jgi:hypothetical protein
MKDDADREQEPNAMLPIIAHTWVGVERCGCIIVKVEDGQARYVCNECSAAL